SNGTFTFLPVGNGTYEIVADVGSVPSVGTPSNATIATSITVNSGAPTNLMIPLVAESGSAATVQGLFTTSPITSSGPAVSYIGVQSFTIPGGGTVLAQIPFYNGGTPPTPVINNTTAFPGANCTGVAPLICPGGTLCACYLIILPASNPVVGEANSTGNGYAVPAAGQAAYFMDAFTSIGSSAACSPNEFVSTGFAAGSGVTTTAPELDFSNCQ
ncbi:MAG TPA: hypothetical protein VMB26_08195, partial [Candidatus Binataceae bacterium]|nr:hypothetical protein [Candidatus Binataceae bacterium]